MDTDLLTPAALNDDDWPRLLARCEAALDLDGSARACKAFERPREVKTAQDLVRLALSYGPGGRSLRAAAGWAEESGLASLSDVAVMNRLRKAADWLGVVAGALLAPRAPPGAGARALRIVDASVICAPGRTDGWRLHTAYDPVGQRFLFLELTDTRGAERLDRAPVTADEIRLGDRAYATRPDGVRRLTAEPGDYVVRVSWRGLHWLEPAGGRFDVLAFLEPDPPPSARPRSWSGGPRRRTSRRCRPG